MRMENGEGVSGASNCCSDLHDAVADPDIPIEYSDRFREYGVRILDGGSARLRITHCPWDGRPLPSSLREAWFDAIAALGFEPDDPALPDKYRSGDWWRQRGQV
jgi:hypothetical protein